MMRQDDNKILFNLKTIYLVFFLAIILFITLAMAYKIHQDLYGEIEEGFNQKLTAISTVLANFIDGDIHQSLLEPHDIRELAYIQMEDAIYSVDRSIQKLVRIDPENGLLEEIADISRSNISSLAYDAETDRLYGIDIQSATPQLSLIDRQTGQVEPLASLGQSMDSFTVRSADSLLYSQNSTIASFHIPTATHSVMGETDRESTNGLAYDTAAETLFYLDREDHHVVSRPLSNKENLSRFPLQAISATVEPASNTQEKTTYASIQFPLSEEEMRQAMQFERIRFSGDPAWIQSCREDVNQIARTIARQIGSLAKTRLPSLAEAHFEGLAWDPSRKRLYSDLGMLVSINPQTGEYWKQGWWDGYRSQVDPRYLDIVMPMRRIKSKLNITYLYTFTHPQGGSPDDLAYVLDASMNGDHTPIGAADSFPKGKGFEIYGKVKMGGIYQSEVIEWEDWGLVKTCYAPIYNAQGDVVSVAAADVDVSIISSKTRLALLQTVFIGVAAILIAGLVAYGITLTLLRPIVALKDKTLVVAAGQYGEKVPLQGPAEIKSLCQAFNTLSTTLDRSFKDKQTSNTTLIHQSVRRRLEEYLDFESPLSLIKSQIVYEGVHFTVRNQAIDLSGCEYSFDRSLLWVASSTGSKMNANRIHQEMKSLARRFMDSRQDWDTFLSILRYLYPESIHAFAFFHKESTAFDYFTHSANAAACLFDQEEQKQWAFDRRLSATLEPGQVLLLGNEPLLNDLQANFPFYPLSQAAQGGIDPILKEWKQKVLHEQVQGSLAEGHILVLVRPKS